jgi:hypothetical protein
MEDMIVSVLGWSAELAALLLATKARAQNRHTHWHCMYQPRRRECILFTLAAQLWDSARLGKFQHPIQRVTLTPPAAIFS